MMNRRFSSAVELIHYLDKVPVKVDAETRDRFIHYLRNKVYSFGRFETEIIPQADGSTRNILRKIDFESIRFPISRVFEKKKRGVVYFL